MDSPSRLSVDEAHCLWPLCSHTGCWEAEQRLRTGKPRKLKALTPHRASAMAPQEYRFPVITVVNASDWPDAGSPNELSLKSEDFPEAAANTLSSQAALPSGARTLKNVQIPISSSAVRADPEIHRENKPVKLSMVHIRHLPSNISTSQSSKSILMWVPSSAYRPPRDCRHSAKSPRLAVKKLIFHPSAENRSFETKDKSNTRALQKQSPFKSHLNQEEKGCLDPEAGSDLFWLGSESDLKVKKAPAPAQVRHLVSDPEAKEDQQPPWSAQTLHLRKQPVWGMIQRKHTQEEHKYKRDLQTERDRIDWESLRRQACLWRRHTQPFSSDSTRPSSAEDKADYVP